MTDREKLIELLDKITRVYRLDAWENTDKIADHLIANGVVFPVLCKDCVQYAPYEKPVEDFDGRCLVRECETDEEEFCSYGIRKVD